MAEGTIRYQTLVKKLHVTHSDLHKPFYSSTFSFLASHHQGGAGSGGEEAPSGVLSQGVQEDQGDQDRGALADHLPA